MHVLNGPKELDQILEGLECQIAFWFCLEANKKKNKQQNIVF